MLTGSKNPSRYSTVLVSEGAMIEGGEMVFENAAADAFGHKKLGGIGDLVAEKLKELSPKYNNGKPIDVINQKLGYLVRCGDPDAIDSIVPMAFGNLALDLLLSGSPRTAGGAEKRLLRQCADRSGDVLQRRVVNVKEYYNTDRLRPLYTSFRDEAVVHYGQHGMMADKRGYGCAVWRVDPSLTSASRRV